MSDEIKILFYAQKELPGQALANEILSFKIAGEVVQTDDFDEFKELAAEDRFAAFILDDPDEQQRDFALKNANKAAVLFLLSAVIEKSDAIVALKPFRLSSVLSALISAVNRFKQSGATAFNLGSTVFDPTSRTLSGKGMQTDLTEKESDLLRFLLRSDTPADKDVLLKNVWGFANGVDTHTLETHLYRLRQKLEPFGIKINASADTGYTLAY